MPPISGKKKAGRHSTLLDESKRITSFLEKVEGVNRISPGVIKPGGNRSQSTVKCVISGGSLLLTVHGSHAVQEIRVFAGNLTALQTLIEANFIAR